MKIEKLCQCGKSFISYIKKNSKFCSKTCQHKYRIFKKSGYKCPKGSLAKLGSKNPMWDKIKDNPGYNALHEYVRKRLIKPNYCQHCCKEKKLDLANKSHKYKRELSDWLWLCKKCHCAYDNNYPPIGASKGYKWSKEQKIKSSIAHKGQHVSPRTEFKKGLIPWNKNLKKR